MGNAHRDKAIMLLLCAFVGVVPIQARACSAEAFRGGILVPRV